MNKYFIDQKWYSNTFTANMFYQPWTEQTRTLQEITFIIDQLMLKGNERILDIGCGFGRHSLELAKQGFRVVGVDLSHEFIEYAKGQARLANLSAEFICADFRDVSFSNEFDVVLNLCDGAVGYLETEEENLKMFHLIARALKPDGKNILHIPNIEYVRKKYPMKTWNDGKYMLELIEHDWIEEKRLMFTGAYNIKYGEAFRELKPLRSCQRVYSLDELVAILEPLRVGISEVYGNFDRDIPPSGDCSYLIIITSKLSGSE